MDRAYSFGILVERSVQQGIDFGDVVFNFVTFNLISTKIVQAPLPNIGGMFLWMFKAIHFPKAQTVFKEWYLRLSACLSFFVNDYNPGHLHTSLECLAEWL